MFEKKILNIFGHQGNTNQKSHGDSISLQSEWQSSRKQTTANAGKKAGEYTVGMNVN
jgi:hypothetical protein